MEGFNLPKRVNISIHEEKHEHRAPTDESVRLMKEMEQKMEDRIVDSFRLDNNHLKAVVMAFVVGSGDMLGHKFVGRFELNGVVYKVEDRIEGHLIKGRAEFITLLVKRMSEQIAIQLLKSDRQIEDYINNVNGRKP